MKVYMFLFFWQSSPSFLLSDSSVFWTFLLCGKRFKYGHTNVVMAFTLLVQYEFIIGPIFPSYVLSHQCYAPVFPLLLLENSCKKMSQSFLLSVQIHLLPERSPPGVLLFNGYRQRWSGTDQLSQL